MPTDLPTAYASSRSRIAEMVSDLPAEALARTVPGCPEWTVADMVAHCAGVADDFASGTYPAGDIDAWTQAQVDKRRGTPVADILQEWEAVHPEEVISSVPGALPFVFTVDLITHEHDLRGALGHPDRDDPHAAFAARRYASTLGRRIAEAGLPALRLGDVATAGEDEPGVTVRAEPYEIFRALAGRRSEAQVRAFDWDADPAPYLPILSPFGPLPAADVVEEG